MSAMRVCVLKFYMYTASPAPKRGMTMPVTARYAASPSDSGKLSDEVVVGWVK